MQTEQLVVRESDIRHLLRQAAAETVTATARACVIRSGSEPPHPDEIGPLEEALAWIAARITQCAWDLLPAHPTDAQAPMAWAVHEIIEWAEHLVRFEALGERTYRVPLTWLPRGSHPLGTRDVVAAVEERTELLREELAEHGITVVATTDVTEVAA